MAGGTRASTSADDSEILTLFDEAGQSFELRVLRGLREGGRIYLVAERIPEGTLHALRREGDELVLVKDAEVLAQLDVRMDILARASAGEILTVSVKNGNDRFLGVFEVFPWEGREIKLAADLEDPATVVAFATQDRQLRELDEESAARLRAQMLRAAELSEERDHIG